MLFVHCSHSCRNSFIKRFEPWIEKRCIKKRRNGLIQQIITHDRWFIGIMSSNLFPDVNSELLRFLALKQKWITITVIDIITRLTSRGAMHVQYYINALVLAPFHQ